MIQPVHRPSSYIPMPKSDNAIVKRKCLKCGVKFDAVGRFMRMCEKHRKCN